MNMPALPYFAQIVHFVEASKYLFLFAGAYLEGTVVMLTGGLLWRLHIVQFWPAYLALMAGDSLSDWMWYGIGYFGARRFANRWGYLFGATHEVIEKVERQFHKYHLRILIFSKLTMGFGLAVPILMTAGMMRVSFWRYVVINFLGGVVWIFCVMLIGYYFGNVIDLVPKQFQIVGFIVMVIAFFAFVKFLTSQLAKQNW